MSSLFLLILLQLLPGIHADSDEMQISDETLRKFSQVKTMDDFKRLFNLKEPPVKRTYVDDDSTVDSSIVDKGWADMLGSVCKPRPTTIELFGKNDSRYVYLPRCLIVDRCSGCDLTCAYQRRKHCAPTHNGSITERVTVARTPPDGDFNAAEFIPVTYEKHVACDCLCKVEPSVCDKGRETWSADKCECKCQVAENEKVCPVRKQFVVADCDCVCIEKCGPGETQDKDDCTCSQQDASSYQWSNNEIDSYRGDDDYKTDSNQEDNEIDSSQGDNDDETDSYPEDDDELFGWYDDAMNNVP